MNINRKIRIFRRPSIYVTWRYIYIAATVVLSVIAAIAMTLMIMRFVRVGDIVIKGDNPYDRVDIIETLSVRDDSFWMSVDERELEEKLIKERQLIEEVRVRKSFPNRIVVNVIKSRTQTWYIDISGRRYSLDKELYVIEETNDTEGVTRLELPHVSEVIERRVPAFGESDIERKRTIEIIYEVDNWAVRPRVTALDVSDPNNITVTIDGIYVAKLGNKTDIKGKLEMIMATLETETVKNSNGGELIAYTYSENGYASFLPNE